VGPDKNWYRLKIFRRIHLPPQNSANPAQFSFPRRPTRLHPHQNPKIAPKFPHPSSVPCGGGSHATRSRRSAAPISTASSHPPSFSSQQEHGGCAAVARCPSRQQGHGGRGSLCLDHGGSTLPVSARQQPRHLGTGYCSSFGSPSACLSPVPNCSRFTQASSLST
jgi:hypothetical protein